MRKFLCRLGFHQWRTYLQWYNDDANYETRQKCGNAACPHRRVIRKDFGVYGVENFTTPDEEYASIIEDVRTL